MSDHDLAKLIYKNYIRYKKKYNTDDHILNTRFNFLFSWAETKEGYNFWRLVNDRFPDKKTFISFMNNNLFHSKFVFLHNLY